MPEHMALLPSLGGGNNAGPSFLAPRGPSNMAHADRCKDVLRAGPYRGRSVAALLPPCGNLKPRRTAEVCHAEFGLGGSHTVVRPELA